jgi:hypothetical protein
MQQSRIIKFIRELGPRDRERLSQFVHSPYFNQHEKTHQLLDIILEHVSRSDEEIEKSILYDRLFPGMPYDEQKLHNVLSYLKKQYHRFLAFEYVDQQSMVEQLLTLESAYKNARFELMVNRARHLEKQLRQQTFTDGQYHYTGYRLNYLMGYYGGEFVDRSESGALQRMSDHLDRYFIVEKLRNSCHLTANMMLLNSRYDLGFLEDLLSYVRKRWDEFSNDLGIRLYYTILMSLREEHNATFYAEMKNMLVAYMDVMSKQDGSDLYTFAYNYCIRRINQGDSSYQTELFELYQKGLASGMLLKNNMLSEWDYKNVATLGCSLKAYEWTENFLHHYKDYIPAHQRENAYSYNLANYYYHQKMYNKTLQTLLHVQFTDVKYHLNSNFLLMRTYYALHDTEALLSLIETFRIYVIRNQKITTDQKRSYTNFVRFAKKLVQLRHNASTFSKKILKEKLDDLASKVENTENVINKIWLLEECRN